MNEKIFEEMYKIYLNEEAHRNVKLNNQRKEESRSFQKSKEKVMNSIENFESELNKLSMQYNQVNESNFVSVTDHVNYEVIETNLGEILSEHMNYLERMQAEILDENEGKSFDDKVSSLNEFQTSMYLRHEAKMKEIETKAELASLEADISCLKLGNGNATTHADDLENQMNDIVDEIGWRSRDLLIAETSLEMQACLDMKVKSQRELLAMVDGLLVLWKRQSVRVKVLLTALEQEVGVHNEILDALGSVSGLVGSLKVAKDQLARMERAVNAGDNLYSDDDQLLIRVQNKLTKSFTPLITFLDSAVWAAFACNKQRDSNNALLLELVDNIEISKSCLENIADNAGGLHSFLQDNRAPGGSPRLSLLEGVHYEEYVRAVAEASRVKERLKVIKDDEGRLRVDVTL